MHEYIYDHVSLVLFMQIAHLLREFPEVRFQELLWYAPMNTDFGSDYK